jgi:spermidine synthase
MRRRDVLAITAGAIVSAVAWPAWGDDAPEQTFESPYNFIIVKTMGRTVSFRRMENGKDLSAIDLDNPARQVIPYTGTLFAAALIQPRPAKVLNIGLGAGAINRLFEIAFPQARMTTVEIDPMIVDVARRLTGFAESANNKVVIADGRRYLKQNTETWDWLVIDAYVRNSQVPPHLTTVEFFELAKNRLADHGVLVMNLHQGSKVFASIVATLVKAFPDVALLYVPKGNNVVVLATTTTGTLAKTLREASADGLADIRRFGVDWATFRTPVDPATVVGEAMVLTDDFAPTEFLSGGRTREN